jgi:outer membrane protein assembly factor BamD
MNFRSVRVLVLVVICVVAFPFRSPAPLIYTPGEGWTYEPVGGGPKWQRTRAKDQLEVAQAAFDQKDYSLALKAARRVIKVWPISDYAPTAQYLVGRCYEATGREEKGFKEYQKLLEKQPKIANYPEIVQRQYEIANLYLAGKSFKLWGYLPYGASMSRTAEMYEQIVKTGPFSDIAPQAQLKVGQAHEREKTFCFKTPDYAAAAKAFELAADRYHDRPQVASEALYQAGMAYDKEAQKAEYDQSTAGQAIACFSDFMTLYPADPRVPETAKLITELKREQARGSFQTAKFYEKAHKWKGAMVYYNEVLQHDPESPYAKQARQRMDQLAKLIQPPPPADKEKQAKAH